MDRGFSKLRPGSFENVKAAVLRVIFFFLSHLASLVIWSRYKGWNEMIYSMLPNILFLFLPFSFANRV